MKDPALMFILAIPPQRVRAVFDHLLTLPPEIVSEIRIAGCGLDNAEPKPTQTDGETLFDGKDRTDG